MAALTASAVTINRSWTEGGTNGKEYSCRHVTLVLTGQGGTTNTIGAAVLLLTKLVDCSNFVKNDDAIVYPAAIDTDGDNVLLTSLAQATDANRDDPADITATVVGVVKGWSA